MSRDNILVYIVRRDLRTADNPILHRLSTPDGQKGYTHLLPIYILSPHEIEISGLLKDGEVSPYRKGPRKHPGILKRGPLPVKFLAESVWDMKENLESLGSGLIIQAGSFDHVLKNIFGHFASNEQGPQVGAVWLVEEFSPQEKMEQEHITTVCREFEVDFVMFDDQKQLIDDGNVHLPPVGQFSYSIHEFEKAMEPLHIKPSRPDPRPATSSLPPFPDSEHMPPQNHPFAIPDTLEEMIQRLQEPVEVDFRRWLAKHVQPINHPLGGETCALQRLRHVVKSGIASRYRIRQNDLHVSDRLHKLTPYLSLGCITGRQVHEELLKLEDGTDPDLAQSPGFGEGVNEGTRTIRLELLYRDLVRLSTKKYASLIFCLLGAGLGRGLRKNWKTLAKDVAQPELTLPPKILKMILKQFQRGCTGHGFIDALMRQLFFCGYVSSVARVIVVNFLAMYVGFDWRYGAEWETAMSTDFDASMHWYRWQYYAGVGPDRTGSTCGPLSPHIEALRHCPNGSFIRRWMPELRGLTNLENLAQVATTPPPLLEQFRLSSSIMVTHWVPSDMVDYAILLQKSAAMHHNAYLQSFLSAPTSYYHSQSPWYRYPQYIWVPHPQALPWPWQYPGFIPVPRENYLFGQSMVTLLPDNFQQHILGHMGANPAHHQAPQAAQAAQPPQGPQAAQAAQPPQGPQAAQAPQPQAPQPQAPQPQALQPQAPQPPQVDQPPQPPNNAPRGPRLSLTPPRVHRVRHFRRVRRCRVYQHLSSAQGHRRDSGAPTGAPRAPRGNSQAPHNAPTAPRASRTQTTQTTPTIQTPKDTESEEEDLETDNDLTALRNEPGCSLGNPLAPHDAPRAPKALRTPTSTECGEDDLYSADTLQAPDDAPKAPRQDSQAEQPPHDAPRAPKAMRTPSSTECGQGDLHSNDAPQASGNAPEGPCGNSPAHQAPRDAPTAPRAMRAAQTTQHSQTAGAPSSEAGPSHELVPLAPARLANISPSHGKRRKRFRRSKRGKRGKRGEKGTADEVPEDKRDGD